MKGYLTFLGKIESIHILELAKELAEKNGIDKDSVTNADLVDCRIELHDKRAVMAQFICFSTGTSVRMLLEKTIFLVRAENYKDNDRFLTHDFVVNEVGKNISDDISIDSELIVKILNSNISSIMVYINRKEPVGGCEFKIDTKPVLVPFEQESSVTVNGIAKDYLEIENRSQDLEFAIRLYYKQTVKEVEYIIEIIVFREAGSSQYEIGILDVYKTSIVRYNGDYLAAKVYLTNLIIDNKDIIINYIEETRKNNLK